MGWGLVCVCSDGVDVCTHVYACAHMSVITYNYVLCHKCPSHLSALKQNDCH